MPLDETIDAEDNTYSVQNTHSCTQLQVMALIIVFHQIHCIVIISELQGIWYQRYNVDVIYFTP